MAMRDEDFGAALTLSEVDDGIWSPPMAAPACAPRDWQPLYEQAHSRAEELRRSELGRSFLGGIAEVAARPVSGQAAGGRGGDEGGPPHGEERPCLAGRSDPAGEAPFASRRRVEQAQHDHIAAYGSRPVARSLAGVGGREGYGRGTVSGERPAAQGAGAVAGPDGHDRAAARGTARIAQGNGAVEQGDREAGRGSAGVGGLQGHDQVAARGECRTAEGGEGLGEAVQMAGLRARRSSLGAAGVPRPQGAARGPASRQDRWAEQGDRPAALVLCTGLAGAGGHARAAAQTDRSASGGNRAGEGHHRIASPTQRPTAYRGAGVEGRENGAGLPRRDSGSPACQAPLDPDRLVEGAVREQERAAEEAGHGAQARPAARRPRPRPHPAARTRGEDRTAQPAEGCARLVPVAGSPMWRTASVPHPSSRSRSRPTPAGSSARAGAGVATARPRPWR